jgi:hypothetical protein
VKDRQSGALIAAWPSHSARNLNPNYLSATDMVRKYHCWSIVSSNVRHSHNFSASATVRFHRYPSWSRTGPMPVMISRSGRRPWRTSRRWPASVSLSAWPPRKPVFRCSKNGQIFRSRNSDGPLSHIKGSIACRISVGVGGGVLPAARRGARQRAGYARRSLQHAFMPARDAFSGVCQARLSRERNYAYGRKSVCRLQDGCPCRNKNSLSGFLRRGSKSLDLARPPGGWGVGGRASPEHIA